MRTQGPCAGRPKGRKPRTTDGHHTRPVAPNPLGRDCTAEAPDREWVADITGIPTRGGWLSLAGSLDASSRRAIGYAMDTSRDERLVEAALDMALLSRRPRAGRPIHHSDRGSQHSSAGYRGTLEGCGIRMSMSGKGGPDDNALMGSSFSTLKGEGVERHDFRPPAEARTRVFESLEVFYNRQRLHSSLGYRSPMAFEHLAFEHLPVIT